MRKRRILSLLLGISLLLSGCGLFLPAGDPETIRETVPQPTQEQIPEPAGTPEHPEVTTEEPEQTMTLAVSTDNLLRHEHTLEMLKQELAASGISLLLLSAEALGTDAEILESRGAWDLFLSEAVTFAGLSPEMADSADFFRFSDYPEAWAYLDGETEEKAEAALPAQGLRVLGHFENGFQILTNSVRPVEKPEDLQGLHMRIPAGDAQSRQLFLRLGAEPAELPERELASALQRGLCDGQASTIFVLREEHLDEFQPFVTVSNHRYCGMCLVIREELWQSLSVGRQQVLSETVQRAAQADREEMQVKTEELLLLLEAEGIRISRPELSAFRTLVSDSGEETAGNA